MEIQTAITLLTVIAALLTIVIVTLVGVIIVLVVKLNKLVSSVNDLTLHVHTVFDNALALLSPAKLFTTVLDMIRNKK